MTQSRSEGSAIGEYVNGDRTEAEGNLLYETFTDQSTGSDEFSLLHGEESVHRSADRGVLDRRLERITGQRQEMCGFSKDSHLVGSAH